MTSPPPHKDIYEAGRIAAAVSARYAVDFLPSNEWAVFDYGGAEDEQRKEVFRGNSDTVCENWIGRQVASAVARFLLSREPSEGMRGAGSALVRTAIGSSTYFADDAAGIYRNMNAARLVELGLDAKEGNHSQ